MLNEPNIGYKLFRYKNNKLYPLYVLNNQEVPIGIWIPAQAGTKGKDDKHVKSKLGDLAYRPGWHINEYAPVVEHIGKRSDDGTLIQSKDTVWCEVQYNTYINYQNEAYQEGLYKGKINSTKAFLRHIPMNGYYRYKTNSKQTYPWIISGEIKVNRILSDEEVDSLCLQAGLTPQKREL